MDVGITLQFRNPPRWRRPWDEFWDESMRWMVDCERYGLDCLWIPEHFFTVDAYGPSIPIILTLLIERPSHIGIDSDIYVLPLHHPAQLAQETAVLDHVSGGRLNVGVGLGHRLVEYKAFGVDRRDRRSRMEEGLDVLKPAWTTRPFSYHGTHFDLDEVAVYPEPLQQPHPPLWVAATAPPGAERAGRHGAHLQAASVDPAVFEAYQAGLAAGGHDPGDHRVGNSFFITVTREDPDKLFERNREAFEYRMQFSRAIRLEPGDPILRVSENTEDCRGILGSPESVLEELEAYVRRFGLTDMIMVGPPGGMNATDAETSIALFGEEVLPVLKTW